MARGRRRDAGPHRLVRGASPPIRPGRRAARRQLWAARRDARRASANNKREGEGAGAAAEEALIGFETRGPERSCHIKNSRIHTHTRSLACAVPRSLFRSVRRDTRICPFSRLSLQPRKPHTAQATAHHASIHALHSPLTLTRNLARQTTQPTSRPCPSPLHHKRPTNPRSA